MKHPVKINKTLFVILTGLGVNVIAALRPELLPFFNGAVEYLTNSGLITLAGLMKSPISHA